MIYTDNVRVHHAEVRDTGVSTESAEQAQMSTASNPQARDRNEIAKPAPSKTP